MKKIKKFIKNNIKLVIGIMIGLAIAGSIGVYAATVIASKDVTYSNTASGLSATTVQGAIDELYEKAKSSESKCPEGKICGNIEELKSYLSIASKVGDYVKMTPTSTSYTIDTSKTGYPYGQGINPSELNLWRVIRINSDETIEMVSEYVSSVNVYFLGKKGYQNYVGYLNTIAKQYENSKYTVSSRHMGYSNQTPYITNTSALTATSPPQTSSTSSSNVTSATEAKGLGDMGYETDYNLVNNALGTLVATSAGTGKVPSYWIASRYYYYNSSNHWSFSGRFVDTSGSLSEYGVYYYFGGSFQNSETGRAVRPIVTLRSGVKVSSGDGSSSSPFVLS